MTKRKKNNLQRPFGRAPNTNQEKLHPGNSQAVQERRLRSWELRKTGASLRAIAAVIGVNHVTVKRYLDRTLKELERQEINLARQAKSMEIARLDDMLLRLQPLLQSRNRLEMIQAIEKAIKIGERRSRLLGLDAPTKVAPTTPDGETSYGEELTDEELLRRAERIVTLERARLRVSKPGGDDGAGQGEGVGPA